MASLVCITNNRLQLCDTSNRFCVNWQLLQLTWRVCNLFVVKWSPERWSRMLSCHPWLISKFDNEGRRGKYSPVPMFLHVLRSINNADGDIFCTTIVEIHLNTWYLMQICQNAWNDSSCTTSINCNATVSDAQCSVSNDYQLDPALDSNMMHGLNVETFWKGHQQCQSTWLVANELCIYYCIDKKNMHYTTIKWILNNESTGLTAHIIFLYPLISCLRSDSSNLRK